MTERKRNIISCVLILGSLVLIGLGVMRGEPGNVLTKAINLCMQCIGIG